jgi:hypothetical protein
MQAALSQFVFGRFNAGFKTIGRYTQQQAPQFLFGWSMLGIQHCDNFGYVVSSYA